MGSIPAQWMEAVRVCLVENEPAVRGDFLVKLGRSDEARVELERAASLTRNARERDLLLSRIASL